MDYKTWFCGSYRLLGVLYLLAFGTAALARRFGLSLRGHIALLVLHLCGFERYRALRCCRTTRIPVATRRCERALLNSAFWLRPAQVAFTRFLRGVFALDTPSNASLPNTRCLALRITPRSTAFCRVFATLVCMVFALLAAPFHKRISTGFSHS